MDQPLLAQSQDLSCGNLEQGRVCPDTVPLDGGVNGRLLTQAMVYFGDIKPFLEENEDVGTSLGPKLLAFFHTPQTKSKLHIQIAATVDWSEPLIKACYDLEGDGPLALECYERVDRVLASIATENVPNVRATAENLTRQPPSHPHHEQWVTYTRSCVKDGLNYFKRQLELSLKTPLAVFKGCWLFSPQKVRKMNPTAASVDESLSCIPFFDANERDKLKEELHTSLDSRPLPTYLAEAADIDRDFDQLRGGSFMPQHFLTGQQQVRK